MPTLSLLTTAFLPLATRMAAEEVRAGRWSETWARDNNAARMLARRMATEALMNPAKGAAMLVGEIALEVGRLLPAAVEMRRAA